LTSRSPLLSPLIQHHVERRQVLARSAEGIHTAHPRTRALPLPAVHSATLCRRTLLDTRAQIVERAERSMWIAFIASKDTRRMNQNVRSTRRNQVTDCDILTCCAGRFKCRQRCMHYERIRGAKTREIGGRAAACRVGALSCNVQTRACGTEEGNGHCDRIDRPRPLRLALAFATLGVLSLGLCRHVCCCHFRVSRMPPKSLPQYQ
jgi:hypothetical protein